MNNKILTIARECLGPMTLIAIAAIMYDTNGNKMAQPAGYKYTVLLPLHGYDKLSIRIDGAQQMEAPLTGAEPTVEFENLAVRPYVNRDGRLALTATAAGIHKVDKTETVDFDLSD